MGLVEDRTSDKKVIKQVVRLATVLDAPAMIGAGIAGYIQTPQGIQQAYCVWASHIAESAKRRFYKTRNTKKTAFAKYETAAAQNPEAIKAKLALIKKECCVIRLIAHTQPEQTPLEAKKAQIIEI
jgi:large subunit ribosomal protein L3e